jgi:hypothetical protein
MIAQQKPEGMTEKEWNSVKSLPPEMRSSALSLWQNMQDCPAPSLDSLPPRAISRPVQLPLWPEAARGTPNSFLRSALFAAIQGKTRRLLKGEVIASQGDYTVAFRGEQLDQSDLDTWEQAAHLVKCQPLGNVCIFNGNAFLKAMGRSNGKANYKWLHDSLSRLVACAVEIRHGKRVFTGSLISSFVRDEETRLYKITLDPDTLKLFGSCDWSSIEWAERLALKGKPLALWLHGYIASHADLHPVKVETLRNLSGSRAVNIRNFKIASKKAFADLEKVSGISAAFDDDLVLIKKNPTASQARHLQKKNRSPKKP